MSPETDVEKLLRLLPQYQGEPVVPETLHQHFTLSNLPDIITFLIEQRQSFIKQIGLMRGAYLHELSHSINPNVPEEIDQLVKEFIQSAPNQTFLVFGSPAEQNSIPIHTTLEPAKSIFEGTNTIFLISHTDEEIEWPECAFFNGLSRNPTCVSRAGVLLYAHPNDMFAGMPIFERPIAQHLPN